MNKFSLRFFTISHHASGLRSATTTRAHFTSPIKNITSRRTYSTNTNLKMQSAQITEWNQVPKISTVDKPETPKDDSVVQIRVVASAVHQLVRSRVTGKHYTATTLPHTPGVDGTGINVATGQPVYFTLMPFGPAPGSFSEIVNVNARQVFPLPEGVDPVVAAGLVNPVMSSWMGLKHRADLPKEGGWKAFIIGAGSASGRLAVKIAKQLGAVKVYGAARKEDELKTVEGLDGYVVLNSEDPSKTDFSAASDATVVIDYLWGAWPAAYLKATAAAGVKSPLQWVSIGAMAGEGSEIPSALLRSRDVTIRGAGPGGWNPVLLGSETGNMLDVLKGVKEDKNLIQKVPFKDLEKSWGLKGPRVVLSMEE